MNLEIEKQQRNEFCSIPLAAVTAAKVNSGQFGSVKGPLSSLPGRLDFTHQDWT